MANNIGFLLFSILLTNCMMAQTGLSNEPFPDLSISYQLQVDSDQPMLSILLSGATCQIAHTDQLSLLKGEDGLQQMSVRGYQNIRENEGVLLMNLFGKKQYIDLKSTDSNDFLSTFDSYADQLKKTDIKKDVAGWPCQKKVGRFVINDKQLDIVVYIASINYSGTHPVYGSMYDKLEGIPLRILMRNEYGIFQLEAKKVGRAPIIKPIPQSERSGYKKFDPNSTENSFQLPLERN